MSAMHRKCGKGLENGGLVVSFFVFLRFSLFLEGKAGRKSGRETSVASQAPNWDLSCNPGMCLHGTQARDPSVYGTTPNTEPHQSGLGVIFHKSGHRKPNETTEQRREGSGGLACGWLGEEPSRLRGPEVGARPAACPVGVGSECRVCGSQGREQEEEG